jgi:protein-tyrosine phosphatase
LRQRLRRAGVVARVQSAGLLEGGNPASPYGVDVLREQGIDVSGHRSQTMTLELLRGADLIVAMARQHLIEAVVQAPYLFPRTFTLKELVRRGGAVGARAPDQSLEAWLARVHAGRATKNLMGTSAEDDVKDPIGRPRRDYVQMVSELDGLIDRLVWLAWGAAEGRSRSDEEQAS